MIIAYSGDFFFSSMNEESIKPGPNLFVQHS